MRITNKYSVLLILMICLALAGYFVSLVIEVFDSDPPQLNISFDSIQVPQLFKDSIKQERK